MILPDLAVVLLRAWLRSLLWRSVIAGPARQLFYCFFQPTRFASEFEPTELNERVESMLHFVFLLFILDYPLSVALQLILDRVVLGQTVLSSLLPDLTTALWTTALGVAWGVISGVIGNIRLGLALGIALGITGALLVQTPLGIANGIVIAGALSLLGGLIGGNTWGIPGGLLGTLIAGVASLLLDTTRWHIGALEITFTFFFVYLVGYYRLPLYPLSAVSLLKAYSKSRKKPKDVFTHLQHSALHWDECVYLPLPRLIPLLRIAVREDPEMAAQEIVFIVTQRPQQIAAARIALLEIALHELEVCVSLEDIAQAAYRLADILSEVMKQIVPQWITIFAHLSDASFDAARYCSPLDRQSRRKALDEMIDNLNKINLATSFDDARLLQRLKGVVDTWLKAAQDEQVLFTQTPMEVGQIEDPFSPGEANERSPFVGRLDLVHIVETMLSKSGSHPTFFMNGERRMGKSSTLRQLPHLLGSRYIPIMYDLLRPGMCASTPAFLSSIAREVYKALQTRAIFLRPFEATMLENGRYSNEAAYYIPFNTWIEEVVRIVEQRDRILLLAFDEFEKLEEAQQAQALNVRLLLDWFRSTIEHYPRLALLFSGVRSVGEMGRETGINWSSYFVNAQTLKVSFLDQDEAHQLIINPRENFPGQQVFGDKVAQEIIRVTGCHPFLIQAVCSKLIEYLNLNKLDHADMQHVELATLKVLENWWDTYFRDVWRRTEKEQRICLFTLKRMGTATMQQIAEQSMLDEYTLRQALRTLLKRDLILEAQGSYRIAAPIFSEWVERNR